MFLHIKTKIILIFIAIVLLASAISIGIAAFAVQKNLTDDLLKRITDNTKATIADLSNFMLVNDKEGVVSLIFNQKSSHRDMAHLLVLDENSKLVASTLINESPDDIIKSNVLPSGVNEQITLLQEKDGEQIYDIALRLNYGTGYLISGYFKDQIDTSVWGIIWWLVLGSTIAMFFSIFFSLFFVSSLFRPLRNLKDAVEKITSGDLDAKAEIMSRDELGDLAKVFNTMAGKLKESYSTLEEKVSTRTAELDQKVVAMQESKLAVYNLVDDLEKGEKELAATKAKNDAVLASIGDGIIAVDKAGKIIFINKGAADKLGLNEEDLLGKDMYEAFLIEDEKGNPLPHDERPLYLALTNATSTTTTVIGTSAYYYARKGKSPILVAATVTPVILNGQTIGAVEVFRDIGQEKEIDRQKSEFISLASHQLRTPLGSMRWNLELLQDEVKPLPEAAQEQLREAYRSNLRVIRLVGDLLNVTRIEQGRVNDIPELTNVVEIIKSAVKEMEPEAEKRSVKIEIKIKKENIPQIVIDPKLFREVIQNLLSNAVKYTLSLMGGLVLVEVDSTDTTLEIKISDSGIGIPEKEKSKIFTKFARAENAVRIDTEGSGLGLYIVKSFVERWGGKIWFESEEKKGSTFFITLPLLSQVVGGKTAI